MAPVTATNVGMEPQVVDSPKLEELMNKLNSIKAVEDSLPPMEELVLELASHTTWQFEEQADLCDWIPALNVIDASIRYIVQQHPKLLLVPPVSRKNENTTPTQVATSLEDVACIPQQVMDALCTLLRFTSVLLSNSTNKNVYNSVQELADLLAAADDTIASLALECLCHLAIAPALHKLQAPELHHHSTALHSSTGAVYARLLALARGWGTRGSGLGLLQCVTADDSEFGQGALAKEAGLVHFEFVTNKQDLVTIQLDESNILVEESTDRMDDGTETSKQKRRKTNVNTTTSRTCKTKSTAELFFTSIEQAGGRDVVPEHSQFLLLADIRLARGFYSQANRVEAIENRLRALVAMLYAHPSQDITSGYFQAQPELVMELIDLLRPTVSSASVSAAAARPKENGDALLCISALANSPQVPYAVRNLAVDALTALVARRDGGGLTGVARQSNVLSELGVGKGMYLGLLPTLIRYSLASLCTFLSMNETMTTKSKPVTNVDVADAVGMDIGLAFVKATKPEPLPAGEQMCRALEFVDAVLTLTSSVVSAPSGTAALTDCGLIPALLNTVSSDAKSPFFFLTENSLLSPEECSRTRSLLRFITAQSIQILEGAVVTHNNALSAFHDLNGIEVLTSRLSVEMKAIREASDGDSPAVDASGDVEMADAQDSTVRSIHSSQRVLLFSIVNCLTVVFHQESGTATISTLGGVQLRKPELMDAVQEIMDHVDSYGGILVALITSLLSDIMNSDPQVVHHIHGSGLAKSCLKMFTRTAKGERPKIPPVAELIMALPNILSALSLTEDGATAILEANPFPAQLEIFYSPEYAMPKNRCLLNDMTAVVGSGLDEIMRHVPRHRPLVISAIVRAMENVVEIGSKLAEQEEASDSMTISNGAGYANLEEQRTCLMQYASNFGQILEQILQNEEHCEPFVEAGGLTAIINMFQYLMPSGSRFLAHVSCSSCPSVCTLTHSTTENQLSMAFHCIASRHTPGNLVAKMIAILDAHLETLERIQLELREAFCAPSVEGEPALSAKGILEHLPRVPLHDAVESPDFIFNKAAILSRYLRAVVTLQWFSNLFAGFIRAGSQRSQESGNAWGRNEFKWKKELFATPDFQRVMNKVALFSQSSNLEVCRIRTQDGFEERDRSRLKKDKVGTSRVRYRLRIVCPEGAVVRDGIEIDSCANVGSMEMGEIAEAFDRCINSSGVMRYRTSKGWVSELTRGHGREPIAEIVSVWNAQDAGSPMKRPADTKDVQFNVGLADICSVSASILARVQGSYCDLFSSFSREAVLSLKAIPARNVSFDPTKIGGYVKGLLDVLASNIKQGFSASSTCLSSNVAVSDAAVSMYLAAQLSHLQACLFDDKRERRNLNVPLLVRLLYTVEGDSSTLTPSHPFFLNATEFLFQQSLSELQDYSGYRTNGTTDNETTDTAPRQCLTRTVAASVPPAITLMSRLVTSAPASSSTLTSILGRLNETELFVLMADSAPEGMQESDKKLSFRPEYFTKALQCALAESLLAIWNDPRFAFVPAQILHPFASLAGEVLTSLDDASKESNNSSERNRSGGGQWNLFSRSARMQRDNDDDNEEEAARDNFEPSEDVISQVIDMGFSRELALDAIESTRSNRIDVVMEYALSIGHLSPDELSTRRAAREERARRDVAVQGGPENNDESAGAQETVGEPNESSNEDPNGRESGKEKETVESPDELMAKRVDECRHSWIESASNVALNVISGYSVPASNEAELSGLSHVDRGFATRKDDGKGRGDAETEASTTILTSFLLDLCQRYPEERGKVVSNLLDRLASLFTEIPNSDGASWTIQPEHACTFASLCHAAVLYTRALPVVRILVLQKGIVRRLVSCIQTLTQSQAPSRNGGKEAAVWPIWLSPGLLLLDIMAQPIALPAEEFDHKEDVDEEFTVVREERKQQAEDITRIADTIFSSIHKVEVSSEEEPKRDETPCTAAKSSEASNASEGSNGPDYIVAATDDQPSKAADPAAEMNSTGRSRPFANVPPYFPLLTEDSAGACLLLCLDLLGKGSTDGVKRTPPSHGIIQAVLSLLMRLLRSPTVASRCLALGAAGLILSLPKECHFNANTGVVTVILRRLIEDECTLHSSMSSEIRHAIAKLHGEKGSQSSPTESPRISIRSFVQAVTPLICRDPVTFLKAVATTVGIERNDSKDSGSDGNAIVVLLTPNQSTRNSRALADTITTKDSSTPVSLDKRELRASNGTKSQRRKSGARSTSKSRKQKKDKSEQSGKRNATVNGTPANHVMSLLISKVITLGSQQQKPSVDEVNMDTVISDSVGESLYGESTSFLSLADTLEIMANLVLAVPACAAAIHRYRGSSNTNRSGSAYRSVEVPHALSGCQSPPRTFVNLLLHSILPQDRWTFKREQVRDLKSKSNKEESKSRRKAAQMTARVAQTSARLLVALVARAGEGRRRVIADLAFALSGGHLGHCSSSAATASAVAKSSDDAEFHALQAWGDLCIGLAAPRSNGSNDDTSTLSFEVVKLMLDFGMAHALLYAIHRVRLQHPMAASTCASLLLPFEVFTRGSVSDAVQSIADKESEANVKRLKLPLAKKIFETTTGVSAGPSQRNEASFADDAMLEDGFDADTAARTTQGRQNDFDNDDEPMEEAVADFDLMDDGGGHGSEEEEPGMEEMEEDEESDEEMSSDEDSGITEDEDDSESNSDDDEDDSSGDSQDDTIDEEYDGDGEDREGLDWNEGNSDDFLEGPVLDESRNEGGGAPGEFDLDEGWTRIESTGFGGMLLGARRTVRAPAAPNLSERSRGFIDAAEAMIGTLLRTGEIDRNALSEIEGTLGIRISIPNRDSTESDDLGEENPLFAGTMGVARRERRAASASRPVGGDSMGTLPYVHQRSAPDTGYTAMGGGGRWNEISAMEYVYGGPSIAAGSRNYDLSETRPLNAEEEPTPSLSQIDMRLFPGGPAAATHSRTEPSLHPLLCGIDLPPVNALVSDLLPHSARVTRRTRTNRTPGDLNSRSTTAGGQYLVSTPMGHIIRLNRAPGATLADSGTGGSAQITSHGQQGWSDDGLPFDGTVADFSNAFERALGESMAAPHPSGQPEAQEPAARLPTDETNSPPEQPDRQENNATHPSEEAAEGPTFTDPSHTDASGEIEASTQNNNATDNETRLSTAAEDSHPSGDPSSEDAAAHGEGGSPSNDGDGVASSLAAGLRLSPADEATALSDHDMGTETQPDESPDEGNRASEEEGTGPINDNGETSEAMQEDELPEQQPEFQGEAPTAMHDVLAPEQQADQQAEAQVDSSATNASENEVLTCPPGMDQEVFNCLPVEMQREVVEQNRVATEVAGQLDSSSGLDPEALAALPEDMRREVIEQDQRERRAREQAPADPSNAEEMDNASFIASLAPDLRQEILLTADEALLNSLPPNIIAEAQILRERASAQHRRTVNDDGLIGMVQRVGQQAGVSGRNGTESGTSGQPRRKPRPGKMRMECDRSQILYLPSDGKHLSPLPGVSDLKVLLRLLYLRSPIRPQRILQRVFQNICSQSDLRDALCTAFVQLLNGNSAGALAALETISKEYSGDDDWRKKVDAEFPDESFPPRFLIGAAPEVLDAAEYNPLLFRRRQTVSNADSVAASLPISAKGSSDDNLPPVVATTIIDMLLQLCKGSPRICIDALKNEVVGSEFLQDADRSLIFDKLLDLLDKPRYSRSSTNLEQILNLIEIMVSPLSVLPRIGEEEQEISQRDLDAAASAGKEWVDVPRIVVSQPRLQLLCSILRMESCRDVAFAKVNSIARRLCRVEANRGYILGELGGVAQSLATDAIRDLRTLNIRMQDVALAREKEMSKEEDGKSMSNGFKSGFAGGGASSSVTLSVSSSELKLLRVLQTLQSLCVDTSDENSGKKDGRIVVTDELVGIFQSMQLDDLWKNLDSCLHVVKVLEGVKTVEEIDEKHGGNEDDDASDDGPDGKKLQNSVAGLLTRFLPIIEAFFVVNASSRSIRASEPSSEKPEQDGTASTANQEGDSNDAASEEVTLTQTSAAKSPQQQPPAADVQMDGLIDGKRLAEFVQSNRVLLNALVRNNPSLLEKALRSLVQVPQCRALLDFDVKRHWFKTQVRRLRQQASRRHGSLRLSIRRKYVFEDAYQQLRLRNADEMRGRLHITFRNEEGIDAGGLSREFFGILAKEIFNPNYALFTSTEDGCTFQPNPNSSINPDHLSYFRFVGRIVGKALSDGFLLDAHFTRSLYKHMLGQKPTVGDMEAIDPDYYKNLQMILEHNLDDIGLELTFSIEDFSFGRRDIIDLIPNGRNIPVTEDTKEKYVSLVCQHRMTTAISSQIKAYLDGFYEMVSLDLIAIFTPRELELLISGLPDIDVHDLRQNTEYQGYRATDKEIQWFWNVMLSLSRSEKAAFLQFVTGSAKVPLAGFAELQGMRGVQKFSIHKVGGSSGALMSAHTCFNSLDLPVYKSEEELREKLLYAISEGGGAFMFA